MESTVLGGKRIKRSSLNTVIDRTSLTISKIELCLQIEVSDFEIEAYYHNNKKEFKTPAKVKIRQIVLADEIQLKKLDTEREITTSKRW